MPALVSVILDNRTLDLDNKLKERGFSLYDRSFYISSFRNHIYYLGIASCEKIHSREEFWGIGHRYFYLLLGIRFCFSGIEVYNANGYSMDDSEE